MLQQYLVRELSFLSWNSFSQKNVSFIYSIVAIFLKFMYYLSRLIRALKLTYCNLKTYFFLNFVEKYVQLKWKKKVNNKLSILYAWICLNKQGSEYASCPKDVKILNMAKFWIPHGSQYASVVNCSEYARICLDRVLNISQVLKIPGFWIWQGSEYARAAQCSKYTTIWLNMSK